MKKNGIALLVEGLRHSNEGTRQVCARALLLEKQSKEQAAQQQQQPQQPDSQPKFKPKFKPQFKISEISHKSMRERPRSGRENPPNASRFNR
jgi:hypothetical protein